MPQEPHFLDSPFLPDYVKKFTEQVERGEGMNSDQIQLSESVRRAIFFAKYEANCRKSFEVNMDDLRVGIERETRKS